jgi:hypothetical protein
MTFCPSFPRRRESSGVAKGFGFLLKFIPMKIGAGKTPSLDALFAVVSQKARLPQKFQ